MGIKLRRDPATAEIGAACYCRTLSPLRLVLYLPEPRCTKCGRLLWERETVRMLRAAWEQAGAEGVERVARKSYLWQAGQWR
jgi:hypothetical protein